MAVIPGVTVRHDLSPRVIVIPDTETEITIQDLHDTCTDISDDPVNSSFDRLIESAGKEDLGGGVFVGITSTLQDARLAFAERRTLLASGTVTATDATGVTLTDTGATFVSDGVVPGDTIVNGATGAHATAVVVTETTIQGITALDGGAGWTTGDAYSLFDLVQCSVSGGNLVAVDSVGDPLDAIFPTFGTQVVRTSSSSATNQNSQDIEFSSFNGGVTVDTSSIYDGTTFPVGTARQPVNNLADALVIASVRGLTTFYIIGDITIDSGGDYTGYVFVGETPTKSAFTVSSPANTTDAEFENADVSGTLDGGSQLTNCIVENLNYVDGFVSQCVLHSGDIVLSGVETAHFLDCHSGVAAPATPTIDCGGSGSALQMRNYNGGIALKNKTGAEAVTIDLASGHVILESTVTNGTITIRGVGEVTDNSTGSAVVDQTGLLNPASIAGKVLGLEASIEDANNANGNTFDGSLRQAVRLILSGVVGLMDGTEASPEFLALLGTKKRIKVTTVPETGIRADATFDASDGSS